MTPKRTRRHHAQVGVAADADPSAPAGGTRFRWWWALGIIAIAGLGAALLAMQSRRRVGPAVDGAPAAVANVPAAYDSRRAFGYLEKACAIGPRVSGTEGMLKQQQWLKDFFQQQGATVELQEFPARHPQTGQMITMANLIARFGADRPKRFLLAAHYDTRPFPDRDPVNPQGVFLGANDGASGVAALMEISHHFGSLPADVGVDLVFFDGEELVYDGQRDPYFLGSTHFAREHAADPNAPRYQAGILLDMVGDADLQLYLEQNSWRYARPVAREVWDMAGKLGVRAFKSRVKHEVRDDHLPLNTIAKIPTIDIIDFDYPRPSVRGMSYWHTQQDIPANCSGESIVAVVYVVDQWLKSK
ncbi:M28 family peptidase [Roseimaritima ulvae]|uniref:Aminopeptidase YwaD n=1 Tax=Roseimaritima ulvae TaxID=980254 RepID=A0A5B9QSG1_9BACT|nr:M28 family peptidase [Roseimaritima ulvae]QEG39976.1 Aminopeptidase YwaD precursor [Roseimaritima ulvae]